MSTATNSLVFTPVSLNPVTPPKPVEVAASTPQAPFLNQTGLTSKVNNATIGFPLPTFNAPAVYNKVDDPNMIWYTQAMAMPYYQQAPHPFGFWQTYYTPTQNGNIITTGTGAVVQSNTNDAWHSFLNKYTPILATTPHNVVVFYDNTGMAIIASKGFTWEFFKWSAPTQ